MNNRIIATANPDKRRLRKTLSHVPDDAEAILDVGCVRHGQPNRAWGNLHATIYCHYPEAQIVGIDVEGEETRRMQAPGYDVREVNCEEMYLESRFDCIVAGELIEHLSNPGQFIERAEEHLKPNGNLVITTPNPDCLRWSLYAQTNRWTSEDHTSWVGPRQLGTLVERNSDMEIAYKEYMNYTRLPSWFTDRLRAKTYLAVVE